MQRLREMLAHGGIAVLAVVFALAFAAFELADSVSEAAVAALQQYLIDPNRAAVGSTFGSQGQTSTSTPWFEPLPHCS